MSRNGRWERRALRVAWEGMRPLERGTAMLEKEWEVGTFEHRWLVRLCGPADEHGDLCWGQIDVDLHDLADTRSQLCTLAQEVTRASELGCSFDVPPGVR